MKIGDVVSQLMSTHTSNLPNSQRIIPEFAKTFDLLQISRNWNLPRLKLHKRNTQIRDPSLIIKGTMSVLLETSLGDLVIDLLVDTAPKACEK